MHRFDIMLARVCEITTLKTHFYYMIYKFINSDNIQCGFLCPDSIRIYSTYDSSGNERFVLPLLSTDFLVNCVFLSSISALYNYNLNLLYKDFTQVKLRDMYYGLLDDGFASPIHLDPDFDFSNLRLSLSNDGFGSYFVFSDDFDTNLYPELLNNEETVSNLNTYINGGDVSMITDKDLAFQKNIELYNANVLALRATKKVNANVSGSISQSGESQSVDLTPVVQQLSNINNKLQTTEQIDDSQKSITDVLNQQANTIQVDDIGLLRNKKGYY